MNRAYINLVVLLWLSLACSYEGSTNISTVSVFHFINKDWGTSYEGDQGCLRIRCNFYHGDHIKHLYDQLVQVVSSPGLAPSKPSAASTISILSPDINNSTVMDARKLDDSSQDRVSLFRNLVDNKKVGQSQLLMQKHATSGMNRHSLQHHHYDHQSQQHNTSTEVPFSHNLTDHMLVSLYNVHLWWSRSHSHHPIRHCKLPVDLTIAESEESRTFHGTRLFDHAFKNFDAYSTTNPSAHIQRYYVDATLPYLKPDNPIKEFEQLIPGGSYVASDCREGFLGESGRNRKVVELRAQEVRVDGLGGCMASNPDKIKITSDYIMDLVRDVKRDVISNYMFYFAFENSIEPGYVTEKPFDALMAGELMIYQIIHMMNNNLCDAMLGTVPVYLGDSNRLRELLPLTNTATIQEEAFAYDKSSSRKKNKGKDNKIARKAAIFVDDYKDTKELAEYLKYLMKNKTAYEEHRAWRQNFSIEKHLQNHPLLQTSWPCMICEWAASHQDLRSQSISNRDQQKCR
jgi:hypothetical protein